MSLKAIIFTQDRNVTVLFARAVADMPYDWLWLEEMPLAKRIIGREQIDLLLSDCGSEEGRNLVKLARRSELNSACTIFGIATDTADPSLLGLGADVYLSQCLQSQVLADRMRESMALAPQGERRSRRYPVGIPLFLTWGPDHITATALNLSTGGMMVGLERTISISKFEVLAIEFILPGTRTMIQLHARVVWQGLNSRAGLCFLGITDERRNQLAEWARRQAN